MPDYKAIHGKNIQSLASDLDNAEGEGQIWFNTTSGDYKTIVKPAGTWSTSHTLNTGRSDFGSATSSPSSTGLIFGGHPGYVAITEKYNGTSWTEVGDLNQGRKQGGGAGPSTATLCITGQWSGNDNQDVVEEWNNTSWTEIADLNVGASAGNNNSCGSVTAALYAGGTRADSDHDKVESWNGTAWTEVADLVGSQASYATCFGNSTAAMLVGGERPSKSADAEEWDGSSWTEVGNINDARDGMGGTGTVDYGMVWAGVSPALVATTELWDGSAWTEVGDLGTARGYIGGNGASASSALAVGGMTPSASALTEEWDFSSTLAAGAWAAGGNLNAAKSVMGHAGTQTAGLVFFGVNNIKKNQLKRIKNMTSYF